jgi:hypothetical protein
MNKKVQTKTNLVILQKMQLGYVEQQLEYALECNLANSTKRKLKKQLNHNAPYKAHYRINTQK